MNGRQENHETKTTSRRSFLAGAAAAAAFSVVSPHVLGGKGKTPPSDRLQIAGVGCGSMGYTTLENCVCPENLGSPRPAKDPKAEVVALCDVDWDFSSETFDRFPDAAAYRDYRRMLDREKGIDAVVVATPDHTHAVITAEALRRGKHVYTQMPMAHDVWEVRQLTEMARNSDVTTQMGNQRHSSPVLRRTCEWIWDGAIGSVREVHCWTRRPIWPQGMDRPSDTPSAPSSLDWNLWLGPVQERPYHSAYHPYRWRGWQDFGTGALGAMGCHVMDAPFWALKLGEASSFSVEADSTGVNSETYPRASTVRYTFPARGDMPPVTVTWHDGGRLPERPPEMPETRGLGGNGTMFVGKKGKLLCGAVASVNDPDDDVPLLLPRSLAGSYRRAPKKLPRIEGPWEHNWVGNHEHDWVDCCREGKEACSSFDYAGPLTEMVLLGNVALLSGSRLDWDRDEMKVTNEPGANSLLRREYRQGWTLQA